MPLVEAVEREGRERVRLRAGADRHLDTPERHWVTYQCRRAEADRYTHAHDTPATGVLPPL